MSKDVISVRTTDAVLDAIKVLKENEISGAPVIDEKNDLRGVISGTDVLGLIGHLIDYHPFLIPFLDILEKHPDELTNIVKNASKKRVEEIMSEPAIVVDENASIYRAASLMWKRDINRLPVVDNDGTLVGIITRKDLLRAFKELGKQK
ncbi:MAG: CBS domain-containing protein [Candidatus Altiarchaeales archaeon ex4484_43]|nr:MAG: CBS domain-containing protein [Candidatus Altiarchaeales archaeon ex4484_43]